MTTPNRNFESQLRNYESARIHGTSNRRVWWDYPGEGLKKHTCPRYDCVAYTGPIQMETYYLCPDCSALAPCSVDNFLHAPYKQLPPKKKRQMASAVCLASFFKKRKNDVYNRADAAVAQSDPSTKAGKL